MPHRTYCPSTHLRNMGVRVEYVDNLPELGLYHHHERLVQVRAGLPPSKERYVLAHEAAHAEMGHEAQDLFCRTMKQERLANSMAGRRLVDYHQMADMHARGVDVKVMSAELRVASAILRAYLWLAAPAMRVASCFAWVLAPVVGLDPEWLPDFT